MYRRVLIALVVFCLLLPGVAVAAAAPPAIGAEAAVLMVANTGRVLYDKNPAGIMYPASTTKIITLITALQRGDLNSIVTVSPRAARCDGSRLELRPGDRLTLRDLLYGMMLVSGNDAAEAVAEHIAGSVPAFVGMMNAQAEKMGAVRTHFSNPHGLPDPINHFTTAYDMALITANAMRNPEFARIVSTSQYTVAFRNRPEVRVFNTNRLLNVYQGANGVKTGYTDAAGDCLVAAAKRRDVQLIAVLLNDDTRWSDAPKLLDYGFSVVNLPPALD
jgi:serine-type D-Ala-D-Ala carboxypeptidase (penicillin-binding protein 5/6)